MFVPVRSSARIRATIRLVLGLLIACIAPVGVVAATFTVNSAADVPDENPGDGICRTASNNTVCTLRAAIMEANSLSGVDTIMLQANTTYLLTQAGFGGDLYIVDSVTIIGAGPASTIIDGNGAATGHRVMQIVPCIGNTTHNIDGSCPGSDHVVVDISGVAFRHGQMTTGFGGGILNGGTLTLENCAITDNRVDNTGLSRGGGIANMGTLTLSDSTVANNTLGIQDPGGAGIYSQGPLTVFNSTISDNVGAAPPGYGGGIWLIGTTATITSSTISGNRADTGGGIDADTSTTLNLFNTTISGNFSQSSGGGLYVSSGSSAGLYNVTVAANQANADAVGTGTGGGVVNDASTVTLANSIVTGNSHRNDGSLLISLDDCTGTITSAGNNLVTHPFCTINGPYSTDNPALGPLQNNGGPTFTHALLPGSAAIDAGNPSGCTDNVGAPLTVDQRGVHRPNGPFCDIGAYEFDNIIFQDGFDR